MQNSRLKNSIVLRGMASNIVDEAIVILKPNIKLKKMEYAKKFKEKELVTFNETIVNEAEEVITHYVDRINEKSKKYEVLKIKRKIKILKITNALMFVILVIALIILK